MASSAGRRRAAAVDGIVRSRRDSVDSCSCRDIDDAVSAFDELVAQTKSDELCRRKLTTHSLNEFSILFDKDNHMPRSGSGRIALFIDGANLHATARTLGFDIDYKRLLGIPGRGTLLRAFTTPRSSRIRSTPRSVRWSTGSITTATPSSPSRPRSSSTPAGRRKVKGNMDIELAVDAMELAEHVDQIVLFSGDGDFRSLVEAVQRRGVRVTVVSTISSQPPMVADELRRQADVFIDVADLQSKIGRDPSQRPAAREALKRSSGDQIL